MYYMAGISKAEFAPFYSLQSSRNWCWAACVKMVLDFYGVVVEQEDVVARIYHRLVDRPANDDQLLEALSGWAVDDRGCGVVIETKNVTDDGDIIGDLEDFHPLIVGLSRPGSTGHLYVLTQVEFWSDRKGSECVTAFLTDPDCPQQLVLPWREFMRRLGFIARVRVRRVGS